ncbi:hypothetical protein [Scytonema millei]|uniref:Uncharacterized protein n=1 Tax=Scytonema millei VB511283 TaxID=1245923 RepID=A0A9X5I7H2_9CYAN|nr:hypothetical protein [Scytonema millei]NHC37517.1 hypothetical protein [Scytonema millei VB511283]
MLYYRRDRLVVNPFSVVSCQLSVVSCQLSVIREQGVGSSELRLTTYFAGRFLAR